jgi:hypothetical protein
MTDLTRFVAARRDMGDAIDVKMLLLLARDIV